MPFDVRGRVNTPFAPELNLPPPYRAVALREVGDAFAHAVKIAADAGAGTLVHVGRFDLAEFAVVLEPDEPLRTARRALFAGLTALADALAVHAPPEKPISFHWPTTIRIDGGVVGGARLAWPPGASEETAPAWLVFGALIRTAAIAGEEPGLHPFGTTLDAEGFDHDSSRLVESFARHLMVAIDTWQQDGFAEVAKNYLSRLALERGVRPELDDNGDLLMRRLDQTAIDRRSLLRDMENPSWLDPTSGAPRL
ncbi:MAG: biotin/lipoate--protein ligase family protein [Bradyrhizobiaceae bacterium]|nr:biotin/lipoate--protein ligase family protein [Bradyrhizobiaceae bacterium]